MKQIYFLFLLLCFAAVTNAQVDSGLVAHYPLNQNANDQTANPANGTVSGATLTTDKDNNSNSAYLFTNAGDRISVASSSKFSFNDFNSFSYSVWVKLASYPPVDGRVLNFTNTDATEINVYGATRGADAGKVQVLNFDGTNIVTKVSLVSSTSLSLDTWYHLVATFSKASNLVTLYINGQKAAETTSAFNTFNNSSLTIGNHPSQDWSFTGTIDQIRIYNRVLAQSEITTLYSGLAHLNNTTDEKLTIYPNPNNGQFEVITNDNSFDKLEVINAYGQKVYEGGFQKEIHLSTLAAGVYFVNLTSNNGRVLNKKVIITK